jgi:hypothetical protein
MSKIEHEAESDFIPIKPPSTSTMNHSGALKGRMSLITTTGNQSNAPSVNFMPTKMAGRPFRGAPNLLRRTLIQNQAEFTKHVPKYVLDLKKDKMHMPTPPFGGPGHIELQSTLKSGFRCLHGSIDSTNNGFPRFGGIQGNMPCSVGNRNRV